jgi:hypothetical protein
MPAFGVESKSAVASRLRGWRNFHVTGRQWRDIGYNVAIDQAGRVWMLRSTHWGVNMVGAHAASGSNPRANHRYVGVLLILGANEQPTAAMIEAFRHWRHTRFLARWPGRTDLRGHGQVPGASTACPGSRVRTLISNGSLGRRPGSTPTPSPPQEVTMSWQENLVPTSTARERIPESYSTRADRALMHILGISWLLRYGKVALNAATRRRFPNLPEEGYSMAVFARATFGKVYMIEEDVANLAKAQAQNAARMASVENLLQQLLDEPGQPIDMDQVAEAARRGAQETFSAFDVRIEINPAQENTSAAADANPGPDEHDE